LADIPSGQEVFKRDIDRHIFRSWMRSNPGAVGGSSVRKTVMRSSGLNKKPAACNVPQHICGIVMLAAHKAAELSACGIRGCVQRHRPHHCLPQCSRMLVSSCCYSEERGNSHADASHILECIGIREKGEKKRQCQVACPNDWWRYGGGGHGLGLRQWTGNKRAWLLTLRGQGMLMAT
jgi:hypothetical protein